MKRKWKVFRDYYLKTAIIGIFAVAGVVCFCYGRINHKENALQVIMMDVRCSMEQEEEFEESLGKIIGLDSEKNFVDISFCHSSEMLLAIMANNTVDLCLMNEAYFEVMRAEGCLYALDELAGEKTYGISVREHPWMTQFGLESADDIIVGIVDGCPNGENADTFVKFLLEK